MSRWLNLGLVVAGIVATFAVGWFARNAAIRGTDVDVVNAIFGVISVVANLVMAGAAVAAFALWRKQLTGASEHDVAMRTLNFAHRLRDAIAHGYLAIPERMDNYVVESRDVDQRIEDLASMQREASSVMADVSARWPKDTPGLISLMLLYADGVHTVLRMAKRKGGVSDAWLTLYGFMHHCSPRTTERVDKIVEAVRQWAAPYTGNGGTVVTQADLADHLHELLTTDLRDISAAAAMVGEKDLPPMDDDE